MGYTHYWDFNFKKTNEEDYQLALRQCQRIIRRHNKKLKSIDSKHPDRLSGYSVHTIVGRYKGLHFNGTKELSHEDFSLREHLRENQGGFCKTARKPYDVCVVACLIILKHYLKDGFQCESDGQHYDWIDGLNLANQLGIKGLKIPESIKNRGGLREVVNYG
jgi:hypothetical protein